MSADNEQDLRVEAWAALQAVSAMVEEGTLVAAGRRLGLHNATVLRRITKLEKTLGRRLFLRDGRKLRATEAALDLAGIGRSTEEALDAALVRLSAQQGAVSGRAIISVPPEITSLLHTKIAKIMNEYPLLDVDLQADPVRRRLGAGEAHLAVRAGAEPNEPDTIVRHWRDVDVGLFCCRAHGDISDDTPIVFVRSSGTQVIRQSVEDLFNQKHPVLTVDTSEQAMELIQSGFGMGPAELSVAKVHKFTRIAPEMNWRFPLWSAIHMDQRDNPVVKAIQNTILSASVCEIHACFP